MKYAAIITAAIIAASPAAACVTNLGCYEQEINSRMTPPPESHMNEIANGIAAATTGEGARIDAQQYSGGGSYGPRNCVTNYGGGGVAITNCY
jgi:hypothetical protein